MDEALRRNRELWDAWTRIHVGSRFYDVPSFRSGERGIRLADYEREEIGSVEGRTLLHLQCHFGLDTLSWARLGAVVTGIDFSAEAITAARGLAADLAIPATFVVANLYDLPSVLDGQFDVVYTSRGVLGWLPDIAGWARIAARFVKPGGVLYVTDIHPVAQVFEDEGVAPGELRLAYPYWSPPEPLRFEVHSSYADREAPTDGLVEYGRRAAARLPPRVRLRRMANGLPRRGRRRALAPARGLGREPPAFLLAQGDEASSRHDNVT
jgi:SAM-dependent methyltransferase